MNIKAHLEHVADKKGKYDLPPLSQKYHGRNIGMLKIKVDKMIEKFLDQAEKFLSDYLKNNHSIQ